MKTVLLITVSSTAHTSKISGPAELDGKSTWNKPFKAKDFLEKPEFLSESKCAAGKCEGVEEDLVAPDDISFKAFKHIHKYLLDGSSTDRDMKPDDTRILAIMDENEVSMNSPYIIKLSPRVLMLFVVIFMVEGFKKSHQTPLA